MIMHMAVRFVGGMASIILLSFPCFILPVKAQDRGSTHTIVDSAGSPVIKYRNSVALVIYVDDYTGWPRLPNTKEEAEQVKEALERQGFRVTLARSPRDYTQLNSEIHTFRSYYAFSRDVDRILIFFTGHGFSRRDVGFLIPADAPLPKISVTGDDPSFYKMALPMEDFYQEAASIFQNRHVLVVLDTCNSGSIFSRKLSSDEGGRESSLSRIENFSRQVITAGSANEEVPSRSVFTPLFIEAINGSADLNQDGYVVVSEIAQYISQQMPVRQNPDHPQTPQYGRIPYQREPVEESGEMVFAANPARIISSRKPPSLVAPESESSVARRSQYKVEYFGNSKVNDGRVVEKVLRQLGFSQTPRLDSWNNAKVSDSIWVGGRVDIEDVRLLAYILIQDGMQLKAIRTFDKTDWHPNPSELEKIQIGADPDLPSNCKPLAIQQIQEATKIDRTTLVCGQ